MSKKRRGTCEKHPDAETIYVDRCDAFWCPLCPRWVEEPCSDPTCRFCVDRPAEPPPVKP
jgi:hypothetical protein